MIIKGNQHVGGGNENMIWGGNQQVGGGGKEMVTVGEYDRSTLYMCVKIT
jgi:hypothetical protein